MSSDTQEQQCDPLKLGCKQSSVIVKTHFTKAWANSDECGPHLQKRVIWEKGTGVPIRSHTQEEKVKHRKVIIWKDLNDKNANTSLSVFRRIGRVQPKMKILLILIQANPSEGKCTYSFGGEKSCSHVKHNWSKQKLFFNGEKKSIRCLNTDCGTQSRYPHALTSKYNLKCHLSHNILNFQMSIIVFKWVHIHIYMSMRTEDIFPSCTSPSC